MTEPLDALEELRQLANQNASEGHVRIDELADIVCQGLAKTSQREAGIEVDFELHFVDLDRTCAVASRGFVVQSVPQVGTDVWMPDVTGKSDHSMFLGTIDDLTLDLRTGRYRAEIETNFPFGAPPPEGVDQMRRAGWEIRVFG